MKKSVIALILLSILALTACAVKEVAALECVADTIDAPTQPVFRFEADYPQEAMLVAAADDGKYAVFAAPSYEFIEEIFTAATLDDALLYLTGRTAAELNPIMVASFPQEEYRFAWSGAGEAGDLLCSAALFFDGTHYYSLSIQCDAAAEKEYRQTFSDLLASISLEAV